MSWETKLCRCQTGLLEIDKEPICLLRVMCHQFLEGLKHYLSCNRECSIFQAKDVVVFHLLTVSNGQRIIARSGLAVSHHEGPEWVEGLHEKFLCLHILKEPSVWAAYKAMHDKSLENVEMYVIPFKKSRMLFIKHMHITAASHVTFYAPLQWTRASYKNQSLCLRSSQTQHTTLRKCNVLEVHKHGMCIITTWCHTRGYTLWGGALVFSKASLVQTAYISYR